MRANFPLILPHLLNSALVMLHACVAIAIAAYLLGAIPTGYLLIRIFRKQDIREVGSGNIGATNALRAGGKGMGAATFAIDCLKGCCSVWLATALWHYTFASGGVGTLPLRSFQAIAALFCVLGNIFPVWLRFKGGKGVTTGFGVFLATVPLAALAAITVFILVIVLSRYVSLASILGALSFPIFVYFLVSGERPVFFVCVQIVVASLIVLRHRQNVTRLCDGTESRIGSK
jgi:acyl phosphate:glycerol-3-phosphate acyltransferase